MHLRHTTLFCLLVSLVPIALSGCRCSCGTDAKEETSSKPTLHEFHLRELPAEGAGAVSAFGSSPPRLVDFMREVYHIAENSASRGILLHIEALGGGLGRLHEVASALSHVRSKGKPIFCYFGSTDNAGYLLASQVCSNISMEEAGSLDITGFALSVIHVADFLDKVGVKADLMQVGDFKGAADPLTRSTMRPEVEQELRSIVRTFDRALIASVSERTKVSPADVRKLLEQGPLDSLYARARGLVDDLRTLDATRKAAKRATSATHVERKEHEEDDFSFRDLISSFREKDADHPDAPYVAMLQVTGAIMEGRDDASEGTHADPFVQELRDVEHDANAKAIVLRINSPGGSALASDIMWKAVHQAASKKPLLVSIGDMAASGGYYIASAGKSVAAGPESLIGSIGVVGGKVQASELASRLGINAQLVKEQEHAGWMSPLHAFSESEKAALEKLLRSTYQRFLKRVSTGRGISVKAVERVAEGRIMTAEVARQARLIDRIETLSATLSRARREAKLPMDAPVFVWPREKNFIEQIAGMVGGASAPSVASLGPAQKLLDPLQSAPLVKLLLSGGATVAAAPPYVLTFSR